MAKCLGSMVSMEVMYLCQCGNRVNFLKNCITGSVIVNITLQFSLSLSLFLSHTHTHTYTCTHTHVLTEETKMDFSTVDIILAILSGAVGVVYFFTKVTVIPLQV